MIGKTKTISLLIIILLTAALLFVSQVNQPAALAAAATVQATDAAPGGGPGGTPPNGAPPDGAPPGGGGAGDSTTNPVLTSTCGAYMLDGKTADPTTDQTYTSSAADVSALCAINAGTLSLTNPTITKTGDTSSADKSSFYGLNAAVLAGSGSAVTITGGTVTANGAGANGVFATGTGSTVTLSKVTIKAYGDGAHAVMATLGGVMTLTDVDMLTTDAHSGAIATDRGSGTITASGGTVTTSGQDSPGIYSTGAITVSNATVTSTGAEAAVIEGENSITLNNTALSSSVDNKWGVMIYQSFSGDAEGSKGTFTMSGGSLAYTAANGPLFYVTNSTGVITLSGVNVTATSGVLMKAEGNDRWGKSGANGGTILFSADGQTLTGNIAADKISSVTLGLQNKSSLKGAINAEHTAKAVNLTLDASSTWEVTADSYLASLTDPDGISGSSLTNITGDGHTVYYDASLAANSALGGKTYSLVNGGELTPLK
jgi:hypothetical protein